MKPMACVECGSAGKLKRTGVLGFMVVPQRISGCKLYLNPETYCGGSVRSMCRSGVCTKRDEAIGQWNRMQERTT